MAAADPTNRDRADWAQPALNVFINNSELGPSYPDEPLQDQIKDLITNLLHLARLDAGVEDMGEFAANAALMADMEMVEDDDG